MKPARTLVLAERDDRTAHAVASEMARRHGDRSVCWLTPQDLGLARWRHRIDRHGRVRTELRVAERELCDPDVDVVFQRLLWIGAPLLATASAEDRSYGEREMTALVLSWLESLAPAVVPPLLAPALVPMLEAEDWRLLAHAAGLECRLGSGGEGRSDLVLVDGNLVSRRPVDPALERRLADLSRRAGVGLLRIRLGGDGALTAVDTFPELGPGEAVARITELLERRAGERRGPT